MIFPNHSRSSPLPVDCKIQMTQETNISQTCTSQSQFLKKIPKGRLSMTISSSKSLGCPLSLPDHQSGALCGSLHHSSSPLRIYWHYIILLKVGVMVSRSTLVISLVPPPPQGTCVALHSVPKHFGAPWRPSLKISLFQKLPLSVCLCYEKKAPELWCPSVEQWCS